MRKLTSIGYRPPPPVEAVELADEIKRKECLWNLTDEMPVLDVLVEYPLDFDQLVQESTRTDHGWISAPIASIKYLIELKCGTRREKDQQDIIGLNERKG